MVLSGRLVDGFYVGTSLEFVGVVLAFPKPLADRYADMLAMAWHVGYVANMLLTQICVGFSDVVSVLCRHVITPICRHHVGTMSAPCPHVHHSSLC